MPYQIRKSDGTLLLSLTDGQIDNSVSSITFVGKNVSNFGEIQNNDYLHILENFASNASPANQLRGQLWYDIQTHKLKFYDGGNWQASAVLDYQTLPPTTSRTGYMWFDSGSKQLYVNVGTTGSDYQLIGPELIPGFGLTRLVSAAILGTDSVTYPVIKITVNGEVISIISASEFVSDHTNGLTGFTKIGRGVTYKNYSTNDVQSLGNSYLSTTATTAINIQGGNSGSIPFQTSAGATSMLPIGDNRSILYCNGTGFVWQSIDTLPAVDHAVNADTLTGGFAGQLVYQSSTATTGYIPFAGLNNVLVTGATRPVWTSYDSITVGGAKLASTATNAYQLRSADQSAFLAASILPSGSSIAERDSLGNISATIFQGTATTAFYADLAENYLADVVYEPGTVVMIGGEKEITASVFGSRAIGAISTNPAYLMNTGLTGGLPVALKGRIPVKVSGRVKKGDRLVASDGGVAIVSNALPDVFAIALESSDEQSVKLIEAVIL